MMNYITAILNFLKHGPTSNSGLTLPAAQYDITSQSASCCGWPIPDLDVQLRLSDNKTVRIFGYPNKDDIPSDMWIPLPGFGDTGPPLLYLRGHIPAYVSYIMGEDWRSRLRDGHHTNNANLFHDGEVILRPSATTSPSEESREDLEALERAHCLRMRRCGAVAVRSDVDILFEETGYARWPDHLFGWPANGGVWILRHDLAEELRVNLMPETTRTGEMQDRFLWASEAIRQQSDMNELCRVLKEAGGQFYTNIEDCPEVKRLSLLD